MGLTIDEFKEELKKREKITPTELKIMNNSEEAKRAGIKIITSSSDKWKTGFASAFWVLVILLGILVFLAASGKLNLVNLSCPAIPACPNATISLQSNNTCNPIINVSLSCPTPIINNNYSIYLINLTI